MTVSFGVVGDVRRSEAAFALADQLGASVALNNSEKHWPAGTNHKRTWVLANTDLADWICVIEDDAILCTDFHTQLDKTLAAAPTPVVSLYAGTGYPIQWQRRIEIAIRQAEAKRQQWIQLPTMLHAVAIAIRQDLVAPMLERIENSCLPIDEAIGAWSLEAGHTISYPTPSLVDHRDDTTLVDHPDGRARTRARRAWRFAG